MNYLRWPRSLNKLRFFWRGTRSIPVLYFHGVERAVADRRLQYLQSPVDLFERQLHFLRQHFEVISLRRLEQHLDEGYAYVDRPMCVLTFDDGYKNNLHLAAPVLKAYDLPFTVFVSTRHVMDGDFFPAYVLRFVVYLNPHHRLAVHTLGRTFSLNGQASRDQTHQEIKAILKKLPQSHVREIVGELQRSLPADLWAEIRERFHSLLPLSWREAAEIADYGGTIGSHCHDHAILHGSQDHDEIQFQLATSKSLLEEYLGPADYFAFPNGQPQDMSPAALAAVPAHGYRLAFSTVRGAVTAGDHRYALPRISADGRNERSLERELWPYLG